MQPEPEPEPNEPNSLHGVRSDAEAAANRMVNQINDIVNETNRTVSAVNQSANGTVLCMVGVA